MRPGNLLVAVRNPSHMQHLERILLKTDTRKIDIVVLSVRILKRGASEGGLEPGQMFADAETQVFSKVVNLAEKAGCDSSAWRESGVSVLIYHVESFKESDKETTDAH